MTRCFSSRKVTLAGFERPGLSEAATVTDRQTEENVLMMKVGEGALRNLFLFRIPGLLFTWGKAELRGEITLKTG